MKVFVVKLRTHLFQNVLCISTDELKSPLETHIHSSEKASLIRLPTSVGLMMARQAGIDRATSEYFAVLDSHMEVTEGN